MNRRIIWAGAFTAALALTPAQAERLTFQQALQRMLGTYPSPQVAALQLERARLENARIESRLGWTLAAEGGGARDFSVIGSPVDRFDGGAGLKRKLGSGATLGLGANYIHEDNAQTFSPLLSNPATTVGVDLSYRQPLGRGAGNPDYTQGLIDAQAQVELAEANRRAVHDQLARQIGQLFYAAAATDARLRNARRAIQRTERLKAYIQRRFRLGLSEDKDRLQTEAQLRTRRAEHQGLVVLWNQQRISLNRLMGRDWDAAFEPTIPDATAPPAVKLDAWLDEARGHDPALQQTRARIALAEAEITRRKDAHKDNLDIVLSLGGRSRSGDDALGGGVNQSETVGGVRLEYSRALDQRGVDAELAQALLDRDVALQERKLAVDDLRYGIASLATEIETNYAALQGFRASLEAEDEKFKEAVARYGEGREETDRLIQFETELSAAELAAEQQLIDLARRWSEVDILRGEIWRRLAPRDVMRETGHKEKQP